MELARRKGYALGEQIAFNALAFDHWCASRARLGLYFSGGDPGKAPDLNGVDIDVAAELDDYLACLPDVVTLKEELATELAECLPKLLAERAVLWLPDCADIAQEMAGRYVNRFVRENVAYVNREDEP
jgi:hypothetical protein